MLSIHLILIWIPEKVKISENLKRDFVFLSNFEVKR